MFSSHLVPVPDAILSVKSLRFEVTEDPSKQLCSGVNVSTVADIKMATPWVVGPGQIPDRPPPRPEGQPVPPPELQVIT